MLRCCVFSCTHTSTACYAAVCSHALIHLRHATLLCVLMHSYIYVMLRCCVFSCTYTSTSCYAGVCSHALIHLRLGVGWGGVGWLAFFITWYILLHYPVWMSRTWFHVKKSIPKSLNNRKAGWLNETDIMKYVWIFVWRKNCHKDMYKALGNLCRQHLWTKTLLSRKKRILLHFMPRWPSKSVQNLHFTLPFHVFWHVLYISSYLENRSRCGETSEEILMEITQCAETHGLLEASAPCLWGVSMELMVFFCLIEIW